MGSRDTIDPVSVAIQVGKIVDCLSGPRWYYVRIGREAQIQCAAGSGMGSQAPMGPSRFGVYAPGTTVLVAIPVDSVHDGASGEMTSTLSSRGYIICSIPEIVDNNKTRVCDWIAPFVGTNATEDLVHSYPAEVYKNAYSDFNLDQPLDAVPESDEGLINEFGVGFGLSRFFSWIRASDMAGMWCFYADKLTRIAAYNYEFWTAGSSHWIKNDEGEINDVELFTPYPWEGLGVLSPEVDCSTDDTEGGAYTAGQENLASEPAKIDQLLIPRLMRVRGYLGDAHREMVVLPKIDLTDDALGLGTGEAFTEAYSNKTTYAGLLDVHKHTDGMYSIRSARGIHFEKYILIPVPKQLAPPEETDEIGDGSTNYKPSGYWGDGPEDIHTKYAWTWSDPERPDTWAAEMYDYNAYMFNWYGVKTTVAHTKDWFLPEEGYFPLSDVVYSGSVIGEGDGPPAGETEGPIDGIYAPEARLSNTFVFPLPKFSEIMIDHRVGGSRYYYSRSLISQLPDGSVLLEDGYGSSIHMTGGNINMSCAGDVWARPGRSMIVWAPDDLVLRGGSSVDITASNADVRIKAERNLHMISGNSGTVGGMILESRSVYDYAGPYKFRNDAGEPLVGEDVDTYGIIFKTVNAPVMMYGADIYVKSISPSSGGGFDAGGNIVLEADRDLMTSGYSVVHYSESGVNEIIGQKLEAGPVVSGASIVNRFDTENTVFGATGLFRAKATNAVLDTDGGGLWSKGTLNISGAVVPVSGTVIDSVIDTLSAAFNTWVDEGLVSLTNYLYTETYDKGIRANPDFIAQAGFTCRNARQYGLLGPSEVEDDVGFFLVESRWQQTYRKKEIGIVWYEPTVAIPGLTTEFTRPHPGQQFWIFDEKYRIFDGTLFDWDELKDVDRGLADEAEPVYDKAWAEQVASEGDKLKPMLMSDNYLISKQYGTD